METNVYRFLLDGVQNFIKFNSGDGCTTLKILKITELCTLKWVKFMLHKTYLHKAIKVSFCGCLGQPQ